MTLATRYFTNDAPQLALTTAISTAAVTLAVTATASYPAVPFTITLERGTVNQEVVLCTAKTASTFTVTRATVPKAHSIGASVEHTTEALDYTEANTHINSTGDVHPQYLLEAAFANKGGVLVATGAGAYSQLAVGVNNYVLTADSAQATGVKWAQIPIQALQDGTITEAKLEAGVVKGLMRRLGSYPTGAVGGEQFWHTVEGRWRGYHGNEGAWVYLPYGANRFSFSQSAPGAGSDGDVHFRW